MSKPRSIIEDVTERVSVARLINEETLAINKCVCGLDLNPIEIVGVYLDDPWVCPKCGVRLVFENKIRVFKVIKP